MQQCTNFASVAAAVDAAGDLKIKRLRKSKHLVEEHGSTNGFNLRTEIISNCAFILGIQMSQSTGWKANRC